MCQYGGLFIILCDKSYSYTKHSALYVDANCHSINICSNVTKTSVFPLRGSQRGSWNIFDGMIIIVFYTFEGYSSGFVDFTITRGEECFGHNLILSDGRSPMFWDDMAEYASDASSLYCSDVWIMTSIDNSEPSPFGNFTFTLNHTQLPFPAADRFTMTVSSSLIVQSSFFVFDENDISMDVCMLNVQNTLSPENYTFTVPLFTHNASSVNASEWTVFKITYTGCDEYPLLAIRVQFSEYRICSPGISHQLVNGIMDGSITEIYVLNDSVSDVYLPRYHPYDYIYRSTFQSYDSIFTRQTCRALVKERTCSPSTFSYQIIRIHYHPERSVVMPHEIDIALKRKNNCSIQCTLDIGILEYIKSNGTSRSRYYEWRGIYRIT